MVQMQTPARTPTQREDALLKANRVRTFRAEKKRKLKFEGLDPVPLLEEPPEEMETMRVFDFLLAVPKFGRVKTNKVLQSIRISPSKTMAGMSRRQRDELVARLRSR